MRHHLVPLNDALNKSTRKAGLPWQLWLACVLWAGLVMALLSVPFGLFLLVGLPALLVFFSRRMSKLWRSLAAPRFRKVITTQERWANHEAISKIDSWWRRLVSGCR